MDDGLHIYLKRLKIRMSFIEPTHFSFSELWSVAWRVAVLIILITALFCIGRIWLTVARADEVNLDIIAKIESNNNPLAYNPKSGACGMYQFTPIAWQDVQKHYPELSAMPFICAYKPQVARLFAKRYLTIIQGYLRHYGLKNSLSNQLACYNQGIGLTKRGILTNETKNYIKKYQRLAQKN